MDTPQKKVVRLLKIGNQPPAPPTEWFSRPHFPKGHLVLLEGAEGVGKGFFATWVVFQIASGAWGPRRSALWMSSEEEESTVRTRLYAAGYDPAIHAPVYFLTVNEGDGILQLPEDRGALQQAAEAAQVGIIVTDVLRDHCAPLPELGIKQRSNNDETWIRPAAGAWEKVAFNTGALVLGLHHQNKAEEGSARSKSTGSGAWRQRARCVVVLAKVNGARAYALDKTNLGVEDTTVRLYDIVEVEELESAMFMPGPVDDGATSIDQWVARQRAAKVQIDNVAELTDWCEENLLAGDPLPPARVGTWSPPHRYLRDKKTPYPTDRTRLRQLAQLSQSDLNRAITAMRAMGLLTPGAGTDKKLYWTPRV